MYSNGKGLEEMTEESSGWYRALCVCVCLCLCVGVCVCVCMCVVWGAGEVVGQECLCFLTTSSFGHAATKVTGEYLPKHKYNHTQTHTHTHTHNTTHTHTHTHTHT